MLDLTKLALQMQGMSQHMSREVEAARKRLEVAESLFEAAKPHQSKLVAHQENLGNRILFNAAKPVEPIDTCSYIPVPPKVHTVFATDGSQISPSAHEIAYCYLLNVGRIILYYGQSRHPVLDSVPEIYYQPEDLYISRQWGIRTEEWMGYRRMVSEAVILAEIGEHLLKTSSQLTTPTLAMVDGSLTYWFLEQLPWEARNLILEPILDAWESLRLAGIPILGYVSASRSSETVSFLRLEACPHPEPNCIKYCPTVGIIDSQGFSKKAPCQGVEPLRDTVVWASKLQPGQRSPLWRSQAKILDLYDGHQVYFCYVNVGTEIARIEIPAWVAENSEQLELALGMMIAQVKKGYGYPVALAEAHNQAVVKGGDRTRFFAMLEQQMIKAGMKNIGTSYKEARKRGSIA
ncbi:DNA double-strand break repair nuclease NurA [Limnoraphis robusta]|uniref:Nuclease n=1 Tax=Limnoraphis robusta CS-951 TaxID=1637645 RepID=A0A0F5Y7W3_9CYAN|nr:DNA double-strand break repair nuclease NurA [Limnoraphis robusta]KKD34843.1 nuclease [Limnoraphis robusta CS-951]